MESCSLRQGSIALSLSSTISATVTHNNYLIYTLIESILFYLGFFPFFSFASCLGNFLSFSPFSFNSFFNFFSLVALPSYICSPSLTSLSTTSFFFCPLTLSLT